MASSPVQQGTLASMIIMSLPEHYFTGDASLMLTLIVAMHLPVETPEDVSSSTNTYLIKPPLSGIIRQD